VVREGIGTYGRITLANKLEIRAVLSIKNERARACCEVISYCSHFPIKQIGLSLHSVDKLNQNKQNKTKTKQTNKKKL
jgi:hypothetical protein